MSETLKTKIAKIDRLIGAVPKVEKHQETIGRDAKVDRLFGKLHSLKSQVNDAVTARKDGISKLSLEEKKASVFDTTDPFVLDMLAFDLNINVRTLVACNEYTSSATLGRMFDEDNGYLAKIIATNPNCSSELLDRIAEIFTNSEIINAVKNNPNVSELTLAKLSIK